MKFHTLVVMSMLATLSTASRNCPGCVITNLGAFCSVTDTEIAANCFKGNFTTLFLIGPKPEKEVPSTRLGPKFFGHKTKLHDIWILGVPISELDSSTFFAFPELEQLGLQEASIEHLPEDLLARSTNLKHFHATECHLTGVPENLFAHNPHLWRTNLANNHLTNVPRGLFEKNPLLKEVWLYNNSLNSLPGGLFKENHNLKYVDLHNNNLTSVSSETFTRSKFNATLKLEGNPLTCDCHFRRHVRRLSQIRWRVHLPPDCETQMIADCCAKGNAQCY